MVGSKKLALTHNQIREKLCLVCLNTAEKLANDKVYEKLESRFPDFPMDKNDVRIPLGVCSTHRMYLTSNSASKNRQKQIENLKLPYGNFSTVVVPDPESRTCQCLLCDRIRGHKNHLLPLRVNPSSSTSSEEVNLSSSISSEEVIELTVPVIDTTAPVPIQDPSSFDLSDLIRVDEPSTPASLPLSPKRSTISFEGDLQKCSVFPLVQTCSNMSKIVQTLLLLQICFRFM